MARGRERRPKPGSKNAGQLARRRPEAGQLPVLAGEGRPEEARVVGPERDRDAGADQGEDRAPGQREGSGRLVRGEADVEGDPRAGQPSDEGRVGSSADTVGDPARLQPPERLGDGVGPAHLSGVDDGGEAEARKAPVDGGEVAGREGQLVPAETEADGARPGVERVEVEDPVRGVGAEVPDRVEEDPHAPVPAPLVRREDGLHRVADGRPPETELLDDRGGDVDLGVRDPLPPEAGSQVAGEEGEIVRRAEEAADVAVEREEAGEAVEGAAGADRRGVGEEGRAGAAREADEGGGPDGPLEVEVQLGPGPEEEPAEGVGVGHAAASYGRARTGAVSLVPSERLWLRAAAFGIDLICLAGGPLLLATVVVFLVGLLAAEPPAGLPWVYRAGQLVFVLLFLLRDVRGASPGKLLLGLEVRTRDGAPVGPFASVLRNLPLLVPLLNLYEAAAVVRRPDSRRLGDRLAGTNVGES